MYVFIRQKIVTWCWKKCHVQTMNCSSTNWRVILITLLEVWRNKTLKFRWKVGENENVCSRTRALVLLSPHAYHASYTTVWKAWKAFFGKLNEKDYLVVEWTAVRWYQTLLVHVQLTILINYERETLSQLRKVKELRKPKYVVTRWLHDDKLKRKRENLTF